MQPAGTLNSAESSKGGRNQSYTSMNWRDKKDIRIFQLPDMRIDAMLDARWMLPD
jgi:hypothetical protein